MKTIKMIALDLDGTLFTDTKEVSDRNKNALARAREKGVHVVITTGRPLKAIEYLLEELDLANENSYSITFNGGLVQKNTGHILDKQEMAWEQAKTIVDTLVPLGLPVDILSDALVYEINQSDAKSLYQAVNPRLTFKEVTDMTAVPKDVVINKVISAFDADVLNHHLPFLQENLKDTVEVFKSRDIVLEFMPKGVHKAAALTQLCQHLGIEPDEVMTLGDEENDLSMIEWAGLGVAMKNAVPLLKEKADVITAYTNNESGLAWAVETYVLGEENGTI